MSDPGQTQRPTPERIFQALNGYQLTAALKAAIELEIFTAIGGGADMAAVIASRCQASERGVRILCDYLVVHGFLTKSGKGYGLAPDAAVFLDRRSHTYIGACTGFLTSPFIRGEFDRLVEAVRKGGTMMGPEGSMAPDHPMWVEFARSMAPLQGLMAETVAKVIGVDPAAKCKVLDIAAGHGMFGVTVARHNPNAEIYAVDWSGVLDVAKENAERAGVSSRFHAIPGDAFRVEFGSDYDLVLLANFLHHFDPAAIEKFMRKTHAALKSGGRAVTLEFIPNEDRISPPFPAAFGVIVLATTAGGDAYTFAEYEQMFRRAGFAENELRVLPSTHGVIISRK
ncbi:MAG TPA: class I SAM-dependent methyltransferase [Candidatus Acidoferrales bacterium]|nr:class I SAM-dependent methyltransferase [Candidatus Acidoferrales bacterium]